MTPTGPAQQNGTDLAVGTYDNGVHIARSFVGFPNFTSIGLAGLRIESASLQTWLSWTYDCNHQETMEVHRVTSPWDEATLSTQGLWGPSTTYIGANSPASNYPACQNTSSNRSIGAEFAIPLDPATFNDWSLNPSSNMGLALIAHAESGNNEYGVESKYGWKRITSSNYLSGQFAPYLALTWQYDDAPQLNAMYPAPGYAAGTLTPELAATGSDQDGWPSPLTYRFFIFDTNDEEVASSPWSTSSTWTPPADALAWGQSYVWQAQVSDGLAETWGPLYPMSVAVPQPLITAGLSQNGNGLGLSPAIGNYTTSSVDAQVATIGPELAIRRYYNSRDPRSTGAFGAGWSSLVDSEVRPADTQSPPNLVTVRYPTGAEVSFGRNASGAWESGSGRFSTLSESGGYTLVDKNATTFTFGQALGNGRYGLSSIKDAAGHTLTLGYVNGHVATITSASNRTLQLSWSTGTTPRVVSVRTDAAVLNDPSTVSEWTYAYSGNRLTSVCPPTSTSACQGYGYNAAETISLHPTAVLDAAPRTYLRLNEAPNSTTAANAAIDSLHLAGGTYTGGVILGGAGPVPGSTSASFNGTSYVELTGEDVALGAYHQSISLWFRTPTGLTTGGVLIGSQNAPAGQASNGWLPDLYVGTDGKLHGRFWTGNLGAMASTLSVNDGQWHHAVLTSNPTGQVLYLDGAQAATTSEQRQPHIALDHVLIGAGQWTGRPATSGDHGFFTGSIAEVALYDRPLTASTVATLYDTGKTPSQPMTSLTRPSGGVTATVNYNQANGTVDSLTDANGGTWTVAEPERRGSDLTYASAVLAAGPTNYWRMQQTAGGTAVNEVNGANATFSDVVLNAPGPFAGISDNPPTAARFDGSTSYMDVDQGPVDTTAPFTISSWVKLNSKATDQFLLAVDGDIGNSAFKLSYDVDGDCWFVEMAGRLPNQTNDWLEMCGPAGEVATDTWTQLAVTVDPPSNTVTLYVNGVLAAQETSTVPFNNHATGMIVGAEWSAGGFLDGTLAELATIGHALTADEIAAQYQAYHDSKGAPVKTVPTTDPMGATSSTTYDLLAGGRLIRSADTRHFDTVYGYDTSGFLRSVTDPNGNMTISGHDVRGNVVSQSTCQDLSENLCSTTYYTHYPNNDDKTLAPDARNDAVLTIRDGRSADMDDQSYQTAFSYDAAGNRIAVTDAVDRVTSTAFTDGTQAAVGGGTVPAGLPILITSPNGATHRVEYYANGDAAATVDAAGERTEFTYDRLGRLTQSKEISDTFPAGLVTTNTYNKNSQLVTTTAPPVINRVTGATHTARTTMSYTVDGLPWKSTIEDLTGGDAARETQRHYNGLGQVDWVQDALGNRTLYTYDLRGNRITQTPANATGTPVGATTKLTYDGERHLLTTAVKDYTPGNDLPLESRDYDPAGRLARVVDAMGWELLYTYTDNNLLASIVRRDATTGASFVVESKTYDAAGLVVGSTGANGTLTTTYEIDQVGRTAAQTVDPGGLDRTTYFTFDPADNVVSTEVTDASGSSQISDSLYDTAGRLVVQTAYPSGTNTPVGRWRLNETSGTTAADSAGISPATATAGVTWTTDHGGAAQFTGSASTISTSGAVVDMSHSFTVSAWVKATNITGYHNVLGVTGTQQSPFEFRNDAGTAGRSTSAPLMCPTRRPSWRNGTPPSRSTHGPI